MELLVAADDRTGAFEAAAALADRGAGPIPVTAWPDVATDPVVAVDLACRHLSPADAADRARGLPAAARHAHKTDSTLRGNWADELAARAEATPVLLVPALPAQGRTCLGGIVYDHGRPVHEGNAGTDVRRRVLTSRPAEALRSAGVRSVAELADTAAVGAWLAAPEGVAVADAEDELAIEAIVEAWCGVDGVVLAGTSAVVGPAGAVVADRHEPAPPPAIDGPILVVCGSVHPAARRQLVAAEQQGVPLAHLADDITGRQLAERGALVLATEIPVGDVDEPVAVAATAALARGLADLRGMVRLGAVVVIGGDTAAATLGQAPVVVHGSVDPGTAWATAAGLDVPVITRSGGFGSDHALVELLRALGWR